MNHTCEKVESFSLVLGTGIINVDVLFCNFRMKWQGQSDNLIDRFDVRAHLDYIPPTKPSKDEEPEVISAEERQINYERFRILAQNEFLGVTEDNFLKQLQLEEQFGVNAHQMDNDKGKKKNSQANAAIGYNYNDSTPTTVPFSQTILSIESSSTSKRFEEFSKEYSDESDVDMDVAIDINKIGTQEAHELNNCGKRYGMMTNDFFSYLTKDEDENQSMKTLKEQEADKILGGGRKSRRERRSQREKRVLGKPLSPPSYAAKEEKVKSFNDEDEDEKSSPENSKSPSPEKITYITSFGGEDELKPHAKISIKLNKPTLKTPGNSKLAGTYADKVKQNADKLRKINDFEREKTDYKRRSRSRNRSRSRSRSINRRRRVSRPRSNRRRGSSRSNSRRRRYSSRSTSGSRRRNYSSRSRSISRRRTRSSRSYSRTYSSGSRTSRSSVRRRSSYRRKSPRRKTISRRRSYSKERSPSRKRTVSRKKSSSRIRSISKKRSYSSSSSSSSSSTTSVDTILSPEKLHLKKSSSREKSPKRKSKSVSREKPSASDQSEIPSTSEVVPVKRYYGRRKDNESSSSLSVSGSDDEKNVASNQR